MTQDTRKDRRVKIVSLNVRYKSATVDEFIENHAHDVSRGGIFIKTANPFPPGTLLKFEIRLASDQAVIAGVGRIVWKRDAGASSAERPSGMGVKFIKLDEPSKVVIDRLVNTKADAGRAFDMEDPTKAPSDRPVPRVSPSVRPATSQHASAPPTVPGARSMSPAGGMASATRGSTMVGSAAPPRKATMIGVGAASVPPAASSSPALQSATSTAPPPKPSFPSAPAAPPRPGGAPTPMFPKSSPEKDWPTKQEPTVMKQAAELLEEALREAGGSMDEIGNNPLFSGTPTSTSANDDHAKAPLANASEWTTADASPANDAPAAADALLSLSAQEKKPVSEPALDLRRARETPTSVRPAAAGARASDQAKAAKKGGSGALIFFLIAAAAVVAGVVRFREQLFGSGVPPEPVAAPPTTETAPAPTAVAEPSAVPAESASASAAASASAPAPPASNSAVSPPASSAALDAVPPTHKGAHATGAAAPIAPSPPPRPRPAAKPAPSPETPTETTAAPAATAEAAPTAAPASSPTSSASSTAPAKGAPPPKTRSGKPSTDDNPY